VLRTLLALTVTSVALAAPAPKAREKEVAYFPTRMGDKREYEVRSGDTVESTYTDTVTKVEKADAALHVTITRDYPGGQSWQTIIAVSADGLFRVSSNGKAVDTPVMLFKLPAKAGTKWERGPEGSQTTYTVVGEEDVEVPAGKYKAVRVEEAVGGGTRTVLWFAPGVGLVKQTNPGSDAIVVLKAFTPGK
jgi:hypothetical protein